MPSRAERALARAEEGLRKRAAAEARECPPVEQAATGHPHMATLLALRALGAVQITVSETQLTVAFDGPPEVEPAPAERPQRNHLSLSETDRDELQRLREEKQMREELGED